MRRVTVALLPCGHWTCNFLSVVYWYTRRQQLSLSYLSRCHIFYRPFFSTRQPTVFPGTCVFHTCLFHQCELLTLCDPIWHVSFPYRWRAKLMLNCYTLFTLLTWVFSTCIFQPCEMSRFVLTFFILAFSNISASPFCHCATQRCVV